MSRYYFGHCHYCKKCDSVPEKFIVKTRTEANNIITIGCSCEEAQQYRDRKLNDGIYGYVYKITNKKTKKFYIGQTKNLFTRWQQHINSKFKFDDIKDLKFEILDVVYNSEMNRSSNAIFVKECYQIRKISRKDRISLCLNDTELYR